MKKNKQNIQGLKHEGNTLSAKLSCCKAGTYKIKKEHKQLKINVKYLRENNDNMKITIGILQEKLQKKGSNLRCSVDKRNFDINIVHFERSRNL